MNRTELLKSERFVYFERSISPGTRYVRAMFAPPNTRPPHSRMLASRAIYGWTLTSAGVVVRVIFANCAPGPDGLPDGCGDWHPGNPADEAGTWVGVGKMLGPIPPHNSDPALCAEERMARRETAEYWMQRLEKQAADEPRLRLERENEALAAKVREAEAREAREKIERDLAELAVLRLEVSSLRETPPAKRSFLARLLGQ
jgi:hypothetical protein